MTAKRTTGPDPWLTPAEMITGDTWGRNTAPGGIGGQRMALADITTIYIIAGEWQFYPGQAKRPQQDSNLRTRLRRPMLYPLSYGGCATQERLPAAGPIRTLSHATARAARHAPKHPPGPGASRCHEPLPSRE
jgi:hypothetical protein